MTPEQAQALKAGEDRFRAAIQAVQGILWTNNARGEMDGEQPGWAALTGQTYDEYQGYGWSKVVHPDDVQLTVDTWHEALRDQKTFVCEHRVQRADGEWRHYAIRAIPIHDEQGEIIEWVGVHTDITEQKLAQDALISSNQLMAMISDAQSLFFGNQDIYNLFEEPLQKLLDFTQSTYGFIGEILTDETGKRYLKCCFLTNISWDEKTRKLWESYRDNGFEFHKLDNLFGHVITTGEIVISNDPPTDPRRSPQGRPAGHPPLKAFLGLPFYKNGKLTGMVGIANRPNGYSMELAHQLQPFLDACANIIEAYRNQCKLVKLTDELRTSEEQLRGYATKLEFSNRDLQQFATIASHDLQAPLRKIITYSDMLRTSLGENLNEETTHYIDRIQRGTGKMQELITDLLALSRVTRQVNPFQSTDLNAVVSEALEVLEVAIQESGAQLSIKPLGIIDGDPTQLKQVFTNLIGNSLKFTQPGETPQIKIDCENDGHWCQLQIQDNGIGFKPEFGERIFKAFERLHGENLYPGTGIGLTIVQSIIERHGGKIQATGELGKGATFKIYLPIKQHASFMKQEAVV